MDKKGILIIVLAVGAFLSWEMYYGKQMQAAQREQRAAKEVAAAKALEAAKANPPPLEAETKTTPGAAPAVAPAPVAAPVEAPAEEIVEKVATTSAEYAFTTFGGGIRNVRLFDHLVDKTSGTKVVLNEWGTIPIGAVT